ncbi:unnamed protein product, partial [marine sediment metagenome]
MAGPGAGTGKAGYWKAGIWVEETAEKGAFALSAAAVLDFDGGVTYEGDFALLGEADLAFVALAVRWGVWHPHADGDITFDGAFIGV